MSKLENISAIYRESILAKNRYNSNDEYVIGHPNALSDGDEKGKGENNDSIGGLTDIKERNFSISRNIYNINKQYCAGAC